MKGERHHRIPASTASESRAGFACNPVRCRLGNDLWDREGALRVPMRWIVSVLRLPGATLPGQRVVVRWVAWLAGLGTWRLMREINELAQVAIMKDSDMNPPARVVLAG